MQPSSNIRLSPEWQSGNILQVSKTPQKSPKLTESIGKNAKKKELKRVIEGLKQQELLERRMGALSLNPSATDERTNAVAEQALEEISNVTEKVNAIAEEPEELELPEDPVQRKVFDAGGYYVKRSDVDLARKELQLVYSYRNGRRAYYDLSKLALGAIEGDKDKPALDLRESIEELGSAKANIFKPFVGRSNSLQGQREGAVEISAQVDMQDTLSSILHKKIREGDITAENLIGFNQAVKGLKAQIDEGYNIKVSAFNGDASEIERDCEECIAKWEPLFAKARELHSFVERRLEDLLEKIEYMESFSPVASNSGTVKALSKLACLKFIDEDREVKNLVQARQRQKETPDLVSQEEQIKKQDIRDLAKNKGLDATFKILEKNEKLKRSLKSTFEAIKHSWHETVDDLFVIATKLDDYVTIVDYLKNHRVLPYSYLYNLPWTGKKSTQYSSQMSQVSFRFSDNYVKNLGSIQLNYSHPQVSAEQQPFLEEIEAEALAADNLRDRLNAWKQFQGIVEEQKAHLNVLVDANIWMWGEKKKKIKDLIATVAAPTDEISEETITHKKPAPQQEKTAEKVRKLLEEINALGVTIKAQQEKLANMKRFDVEALKREFSSYESRWEGISKQARALKQPVDRTRRRLNKKIKTYQGMRLNGKSVTTLREFSCVGPKVEKVIATSDILKANREDHLKDLETRWNGSTGVKESFKQVADSMNKLYYDIRYIEENKTLPGYLSSWWSTTPQIDREFKSPLEVSQDTPMSDVVTDYEGDRRKVDVKEKVVI